GSFEDELIDAESGRAQQPRHTKHRYRDGHSRRAPDPPGRQWRVRSPYFHNRDATLSSMCGAYPRLPSGDPTADVYESLLQAEASSWWTMRATPRRSIGGFYASVGGNGQASRHRGRLLQRHRVRRLLDSGGRNRRQLSEIQQ